MYSRPQKLAAEFLGTFAVVLFGAGALCAAQALAGETSSATSGITGLASLGAAIAYGLAFAAMNVALGHVSGGHFNPALTIGFWATRRINTFDTLTYWLVQLAGATAAAYVLRWALPETIWRAVALGTPQVAGGLTRGPAMMVEGLATFFLTLVFFGIQTSGRDSVGVLAGAAGGLVIIAGAIFALPLTGAAMNPARAFGPALAASYWTNQGIYWVGPLAGAVVGAWVYEAVFLRHGRA